METEICTCLIPFFTLLKFQTAQAISFPLGLLHVYKYVVPRIKYGMWAICMTYQTRNLFSLRLDAIPKKS